MFRLIALGIFAVSVCAQNAANPYDLARSIDSHNVDWTSIWKKLGVTKPPEMPRCDPASSILCSADVITVLKPSQAIVVVVAPPKDVYLRFLEVGSGWRYAGFHIANKKNFGERYEISRMLGKSFLRVSSQGASGSNVDSEIETWFDLSQQDFEPVFEFTVLGSDLRMAVGISREVHASVFAWRYTTADAVDLDVEVRYSADNGLDLGIKRYRATYERAANQKKFSLREVHPFPNDPPAISNKAFEDLAEIDVEGGVSNEQLLVYTLPRLKQIASGSNADALGWLRSVLSFCKDTPEKRTLQGLLALKR